MQNWRYGAYHDVYIDIAVKHFNSAQDAYIELMRLEDYSPQEGSYTYNSYAWQLFEHVQQDCIITICFAVMALESYINTVSASHFNDAMAKAIDRLELVSKWTTVLYMATSQELNRGEVPLQRLINAVKYRNSFVHNRSTSLPHSIDDTSSKTSIHPKNDLLIPAYDSLLAIRDLHLWVSVHWESCPLMFWSQQYTNKIYPRFKDVENLWIFPNTYTCVNNYD